MDLASWSLRKFSFPITNTMWGYLLTTALLFFVLTPGVLLSLPPGAGLYTVAATHAVVFALVHKFVGHGLLGY
jgi:hypothetical protein